MTMAKLLLHLPLPIYSLVASLLLLNSIIGNSNGLTLELIHPISQQSSLFQTNFSYEERIQRLVSRSILRANYFSGILSKTVSNTTTVVQEILDIARPLVDLQDFNYIVKIGIGTFKSKLPFKEYYLDMDTGSDFTWMQCEGCTTCFQQKPNPFPSNKSKSFHPILHEDNKPLPYKIAYQDGSYSSGIYAKETIHLNSNKGSMKRVQGFIFGCGLVNKVDYGHKNNRIAGILGLGWGSYSFVSQIKESKGRFSYCLPLVNSFTKRIRPKTYLRFGDDIVQGQKAISTTMTKVEGIGTYFVGLQGISINKKRLNISKHVFDRPKGNKGGCIIDSGTPYSRLIEPAYLKLKEGLEDYFSTNKNLQKVMIVGLGLDLCYERRKPQGFKNLPEITFHFQGSNDGLLVRPEGGFEIVKRLKSREYFCLAMISSKGETIIGAHQQTNQRIIYDTQSKKLMFYPQDCSKNS